KQFLNIKNFIPYAPEPDDTLFADAAYLKSEDGQDWYGCQQLFSADTLKITYDDNDVITCITRDVSGLWPAGQSVAELPDTDENRRADIHAAGSLKTVKSFKGFIRRKSCAGRQNRKLNARALIPDDLVIVESDPEKIDTLAVK
ncbi:TPA: phage tail protein, partial [Salmonella enterica subsp. enterica serovar Enteritidis]